MIARFTIQLQDIPALQELDLNDPEGIIEGTGYTIETMGSGSSCVWVRSTEKTINSLKSDLRFEWIEDVEE